ncbi:MAG: alpha-L-arabinofuranosidase C-terminal domain-containing protein [Verrucomicrobiota bacterium]
MDRSQTTASRACSTYIDALEKIADGAKHKVVVFELNANTPSQRRALANALAMNAIERDGRLPIVCSANCLQPDGQNDNGWDQGLLFLNPAQVWLQPPGYVTRMMSQQHQPLIVQSEVQNTDDNFDVTAKRSEDSKYLVLQVVNISDASRPANLAITGFKPAARWAKVEILSAPLSAANTATAPTQVTSQRADWEHKLTKGRATYQFPPHSFTVIEFR